MNTNEINIDDLLFEYVSYIKIFNAYLQKEYELKDIPYNLSGKAFPKIGSVIIDSLKVDYRFHGRGCTLNWKGFDVFFNVDAVSKHQIIVTLGGWERFLETRIPNFNDLHLSDKTSEIMEDLEQRGIFMKRKPSDLGTFHVNELWYKAYKENVAFNGEGKNDIDWI